MRAYRTEAIGIVSIVAAEGAAKAKALTLRAAKDAGYAIGFSSIRVRRAPEFDPWALMVA